ncbi:MAG TPA: YwiC-like family protein [Thermoanaerobaculia bacterium]|nr:YwiC-like family protein [Thermoanaerobaculia bacterium]
MSSAGPFPLIRPLAIPVEHGAWGFLLEPIALGLLIAPSLAGVAIAIGTLAFFLVRQPLKLLLYDWAKKKSYPRTRSCELLVAVYSIAAVITFAAAFSRALVPLLFAVPFGAVQFIYDYRKQSRALISELCGAIAPAPVIAAILLAGGKSTSIAVAFAALVLARSIPAVLYVRSILRGESRAVMLTAHAIAVGVGAFTFPLAVIPTAALFARAIVPVHGVRAQTLGMREIGWGAMFVVLTAVAFYS